MRIFLFPLLTMSAAASVAALLVMALRFPLKKVPRWLTCALWLVVLVRMICPVGLSLPVSLIPSAVSDGTAVQQVLSTVYANGTAVRQLFSHSGETAVNPPSVPPTGNAGSETDTQTAVSPASETPAPSVSTVPTAPADASPSLSWSALFGMIWAAGCAGALLWGIVSYARWKGRIADAVLIRDNIYETDQVDTPFVCGIIRPRIYLPAELSPEDRPYVLLHEKAHIRRLDFLTKPLAYLALCVHWFNPVLWLSYLLFCRDMEVACDEAVLRSCGREDRANYAAALLHLGRRVPSPRAVPLAFGETDAKNRIRRVLLYHRPGVIICSLAALVCLLMAILLLANPGTRGPQLEGVAITECCIWDGPLPVDLPEDLRDELVHLLKQAGNDGYVKGEVSLSDIQKENAIVFSDGNRGTEYWLLGGPEPLSLVRNNHDTYTYMDKPQQMAGLSELASMPAYADWWSDLQDYLNNQRADELYELKTPYIGDVSACGAILNALNAQKIIGPYTVELQTAEEPYGITLHAEGQPGSDMTAASFNALSELFYALVDNAGAFNVIYDDLKIPRTIGGNATEEVKNLSREDFHSLYQRTTEAAAVCSYWSPVKALYLAPTMYSEVTEEGMSVYAQSAFAMDADRFTAHVSCLYSSANPKTETYWWPVYESHPTSDEGTAEPSPPLLAPDGTVVLDTRGRAFCNVNDTDGYFTGYRFYYPRADELEDTRWMAHFTEDGNLEYLFRLQQKQGIVTPNGDVSAGYDDNTYLSSNVTLTAGDSHRMTLSLTMPDVTPESCVGGPLSWRECGLTAINTETGQAYSFSGGENRCVPSNLSLKDSVLTAKCEAVTGETLTPGDYEITLTAIDLLGGDGGVVSPGIFLWKGTVTLGDSPTVSTLSALSPVSALSDEEAIREAVAGAFNARIHLGNFFSEDGTTAGFSEEQLAEMTAAYTEQVRTYYSKTCSPYWDYPQENEQILSGDYMAPSSIFMLFDSGVLSCDIKRLSIDSKNRTAAVTADVVTWSNAVWNFEDEEALAAARNLDVINGSYHSLWQAIKA